MTDGDDAPEEGEAVDAETLEERLAAADEQLDAAETEADLDDVEATLDEIETDLESADLPEPDDEDEADPREELESALSDSRDRLEDERGPYASDVVSEIEDARGTVEDAEWTETGEADVAAAVESFVDDANEVLDADVTVDGTALDDLAAALDDVATAVESAGLGPDEDADTIAALLAATGDLTDGLDAAEEWDDLSVREKLQSHGYYDVLDHRKDYPPEWGALKVWEKRARTDMVLLALELLGSDFMERHCLDALKRLGDEEALEPMLQRAQKRDRDAIEILGKIGSDEPVDTLVEYVGTDSDPQLEKATLKALGEIGDDETTQAIADRLVAENDEIRSHAARALGLVGDTRAVEPLADVLADDDSDTVRASAAWALNQIGTESALDAVGEYADDRAYLVQNEAEKAA